MKTIVLGLGNLLNSDEGVGVHAVRVMQEQWATRYPDVDFVDGGTLGLNLLPIVERATHLLLLDCVNAGKPPATLVELDRAELRLFTTVKLSIHQITFQEVLAYAAIRDKLPEYLHLVGIQPVDLEISTELSPEVSAKMPQLLERADAVLQNWMTLAGAAVA